MKKIIALLISLIMLVSLCACNDSTDNEASSSEQDSSLPASSSSTDNVTASSKQDGSSSDVLLDTGDVINVTEKMYVSYINDIYTNTADYVGKTIQIEGMYTAEEFNSNTYHYVYRSGPGCCGNDGNMCGFEFTYDGDMPQENDWIEVIGTLRTYEEEGYTYLALDAASVTVMDTRGAEVVYQ